MTQALATTDGKTRTKGSIRETYFRPVSYPFWGVHLTAIVGVIALGFSWSGLALAVALYYARMFFITAAYHRYFAHRTYKTSRWFQFLLALGGTTAAQKGVLWWAAHHRNHHRYSDQPGDPHSPREGFWRSHVGWITCMDYNETEWHRIRDMARYPELRLLNRYHLVPPIALAVLLFFVGGAHALVWGFFVSTVLLWHGTFTINSLAHVFGSRRYQTDDDSRNNWFLALITMGEGWHNNHHHYMSSAHQGFRWWELDMSVYILLLFEKVGLIWDVRRAPAHVVERPQPELAQVSAEPAAG
jgi:stearoyl-CoA desaturase (delta-9 desaturase)